MEDQTGTGDDLELVNARQNGGTSNTVSESHEADVRKGLITSVLTSSSSLDRSGMMRPG